MEPTLCPRCGGSLRSSSGSYFNTEIICTQCKEEEQQLPGFSVAYATENAEVLKGNYRFAGVGLSAEDRRVIQELIAKRALSAQRPEANPHCPKGAHDA